MPQSKISSKYQLVLPKEVRKKLGLSKGSRLSFYATKRWAILLPYPEDWTEHGWGLGKRVWKGIDPLEYIRQERVSWK
ncbi:MAG: AbrB/MazE/SpoVT family DNA-binding domain-containing protein [Candidatus Portnoybacteria bacterium]|nr:AbrB/MazE/SpoVT family DNA-binding domain-containing protein [Candidatus Portnoybacteria bacterium]